MGYSRGLTQKRIDAKWLRKRAKNAKCDLDPDRTRERTRGLVCRSTNCVSDFSLKNNCFFNKSVFSDVLLKKKYNPPQCTHKFIGSVRKRFPRSPFLLFYFSKKKHDIWKITKADDGNILPNNNRKKQRSCFAQLWIVFVVWWKSTKGRPHSSHFTLMEVAFSYIFELSMSLS